MQSHPLSLTVLVEYRTEGQYTHYTSPLKNPEEAEHDWQFVNVTPVGSLDAHGRQFDPLWYNAKAFEHTQDIIFLKFNSLFKANPVLQVRLETL